MDSHSLTTAAILNTLMVRTCIKLMVQDMQATRLLAGLNNNNNNNRHTYVCTVASS